MGRLDRVLRPRSVAVIGGGIWCESVLDQCRKFGFDGEVWSVHPKKDNFAGLTTYRSMADLPTAPDACFVGVNRDATVDVVRDLSRAGAGGAICFASGFSEAAAELGDGADLQAMLLAAAGDMPILGPNCYGLLNYLDGVALWPDQHGGVPVRSGVAIVLQSSNIAINVTMQTRGLPVAYVVTVGNQAQTGMSVVGADLIEDPRVTVLGLHIEGIDDLRGFEALAARARALGKPVVVLKVGRSTQAQAATISHTASLAGSGAGAAALFERLGVGQASSLSGFIEALKLLHVAGPLPSRNIAAASCSGGEAGLIADSVVHTRVSMPALNTAQRSALRDILGAKVALSNPLDYHTYIWGDAAAMTATFTALMAGDLALGCVVLDFPRSDRCDPSAWRPVLSAVAATAQASGKPMAIVSSLPETMPEDVAADLVAQGVVPLCGMSDAIEAISVAAAIGAGRAAEALLLPARGAAGRILTESEAKAALSRHGLQVPIAAQAASAADAGAEAARIGFPVALKGEGFAHKTDAGAVALGLMSARAVRDAARAMPTNRFLVEEMVLSTVAELLIGVVRDDAHGYVLTVAAGGQLTELLNDRASILVPASRRGVTAALQSLTLWPVLEGYRGKPGADIEAILDAAMALQAYVAAEHPVEVEVNPLMCGPSGALAADALIQLLETK